MKIILDKNKKLGKKMTSADVITYRTNILKEELSRSIIFNYEGHNLNFLDVGGRDGELTYLLGIKANLEYDQKFYEENKRCFESKYTYYGMDLLPNPNCPNLIYGDICNRSFLANWMNHQHFFDVIYSNNVFEHLDNPFQAAENLTSLCKKGGIIMTIVPFSQRYHAVPGDFFRYTHTAIPKIFSNFGKFDEIVGGYDIQGRRNDWQGSGECNDLVPEDNFGSWRETWFTFSVLRKIN